MNEFPESISLVNVKKELCLQQIELASETRKIFTETIIGGIRNLKYNYELPFDSRLINSHRLEIIRELLEKFGSLEIKYSNGSGMVTSTIHPGSDIPNEVVLIKIHIL